MHWRDIPFDPPTHSLRIFGMGCAVLLAAGAIWQGADHLISALSLGGLAIGCGALSWLRPREFRPLFVAWMIAIFPVNWLVSRLLLAIIFYGMVTPLGLFFRLIGRDLLGRRFFPDQESYWQPKATS